MSSIAPTYGPRKMNLVKGQGAWLYDDQGQAYLDFSSGIAVTSLGHNHPALTKALMSQADTLLHVSNLYGIPVQEKLATRLTANSFADAVFFCNSGAEAMEACFKFARRFFWHNNQPERTEIISFSGAFHGRTIATIAAGGSAKYLEGFGPKANGFLQVEFGDLSAAEALIGPKTAALVFEPIQGESGIRPHDAAFIREARELADSYGLLLIVDEVQTGVGRTGTFWAHEDYGISPDLLGSAKGLGGGVPIGATLMTASVADALAPGTHGTTYGGNPLAVSAALAVVEIIDQPNFLQSVQTKGELLTKGLESLIRGDNRILSGHRGKGLMQSVQVQSEIAVSDVVEAARQKGLLTVPAGNQTVRLLPPLNISESEIKDGLTKLERAIKSL